MPLVLASVSLLVALIALQIVRCTFIGDGPALLRLDRLTGATSVVRVAGAEGLEKYLQSPSPTHDSILDYANSSPSQRAPNYCP